MFLSIKTSGLHPLLDDREEGGGGRSGKATGGGGGGEGVFNFDGVQASITTRGEECAWEGRRVGFGNGCTAAAFGPYILSRTVSKPAWQH